MAASTLTSVTTGNATHKIGDTISFTATFSDTVTGADSSSLSITLGTATKTAAYYSGEGESAIVYRYVVVEGDAAPKGIVVPKNPISGSITGADSAPATLTTTAAVTFGGAIVDGVRPTVLSAIPKDSGLFGIGTAPKFALRFSEKVYVPSTQCTVGVNLGIKSANADYVSGNGTDTLVFAYTVTDTDPTVEALTVSGPLQANKVLDLAGNAATASFSPSTDLTGIRIDGQRPTITSVSVPKDRWYGIGSTLLFTVNFSERVYSDASSALPVEFGSNVRQAVFKSGNGSTSLVFSYTVQAGDDDENGITIKSPITGFIEDTAKNAATLTLAERNLSGVKVDATTPTISSISAVSPGTKKIGDELDINIQYSESIYLAGAQPTVSLLVGNSKRSAKYFSGNETNTLKFRYTVAAGDSSESGVTVLSPISPNGTMKDRAGNPAPLTFNLAKHPTCAACGRSGDATFNNSAYNNGGTVSGDATFNDSSLNFGTVGGNATFTYLTSTSGNAVDVTGYANGIVGGLTKDSLGNTITGWMFNTTNNNGYVTGNAIFNNSSTNGNVFNYLTPSVYGNCTFNDTSQNLSDIYGDAVFNNDSQHRGFVRGEGNATFYDNSSCLNGGVGGFAVFNDSSICSGIGGSLSFEVPNPVVFNDTSSNLVNIQGDAVFNNSSYNNGTVNSNATFNDNSYNVGTVNGNATFNDNSFNDGGTVTGNATFNYYSDNGGTVTGNATFNDYSGNYYGIVSGDATFNDYSSNYGTVNSNATFNDGSTNYYGTISGDATFNGSSYNYAYGTVTGNATFNDNSYSSGTVSGNATFRGLSYNRNGIGGNVIVAYEKGINGSSILGVL